MYGVFSFDPSFGRKKNEINKKNEMILVSFRDNDANIENARASFGLLIIDSQSQITI